MKTLLLTTLLLLTTTASAERYYLCESTDGNSSLIREAHTTCRPAKIKREYKEFLEFGFKSDAKKYGWGNEKEALKEAKATYKSSYCRFVQATFVDEAK